VVLVKPRKKWGELNQVQLAPLVIFTMLYIFGHTEFTFKFIFFLIKIFLPSIDKCKHTFSPRPNENVGQQCN